MVMPRSAGKFFIFLLLLGLCLCTIALQCWAKLKIENTPGPSNITTSQDTVYVQMGYLLYSLSLNGKLLNRMNLKQLGVVGIPTDIQVLNKGNILVNDNKLGVIHQCGVNREFCQIIAPAQVGSIQSPFHFYFDEFKQLFYFTESEGDHIYAQKLFSDSLILIADSRQVKAPNHIHRGLDNRLYFSDSGNSRLLLLSDGYTIKFHNVLSTQSAINADHYRPTHFTQSEQGDFWVIQTNRTGEYSSLVRYTENGKYLHKISLSSFARPKQVHSHDDWIYITDSFRNLIYRINSRSEKMEIFGEAQFQNILTPFRKVKYLYFTIQTSAYVASIFFFAILIMFLNRILISPEVRKREKSKWYNNDIKNIQWYEADSSLVRNSQSFITSIFTALNLMLITYFAYKHWSGSISIDSIRLILILFSVACLSWSFAKLICQSMKYKLGIDKSDIYLCDRQGRIMQVDPKRLFVWKNMIAFGPIHFIFRTLTGKYLYNSPTCVSTLLRLLENAKQVNFLNFYYYRLNMLQKPIIEKLFIFISLMGLAFASYFGIITT